jgi:hypothetical protein
VNISEENPGAASGPSQDALEEALKFWRHVFGGERGLLQVWTIHRDEAGRTHEETIKAEYFNYPKAAESAARWALERSAEQRREVYFCSHLLRKPRRKKENAGAVLALWAELDGVEIPEAEPRPTAVIESSPRKYHVHLRMSDSIPPEDAEQLNRRLAACYGADASGFDLTQLLRVPATHNFKYPEKPLVRVLSLDPERAYSPGQLERMLPAASGETGESPEAGETGEAGDEPPVRLGEAAMRWWRGELVERKADGEIDRSQTLLQIGRSLAWAGATRRTIAAAVRERDAALGFSKATGRNDSGRWYADLAARAAEKAARDEENRHSYAFRNGHQGEPFRYDTDGKVSSSSGPLGGWEVMTQSPSPRSSGFTRWASPSPASSSSRR